MVRLYVLLLVIVVAVFLAMEVQGQELQMTWDRVTKDINGATIDAPIEYQVWSQTEGVDDEFKFRTQVKDTVLVVPLKYPSCFSVYILAVRMDTQDVSQPSNIVSECFYADNPQIPVDDEPDLPVVTPAPPESTYLEMRIDG